ncbi:hypothetical protein SEA_ZENITSU_55 [Microbacterium phage Zenitsu]|nr:hypothetical protein SEA_ZENITSU_55 [Microbacterium phage Zenitsu]
MLGEYFRLLDEAYARVEASFTDPWSYTFYGTPVEPVPNTFLANPVPREGYIDARRDDGCVAVITSI